MPLRLLKIMMLSRIHHVRVALPHLALLVLQPMTLDEDKCTDHICIVITYVDISKTSKALRSTMDFRSLGLI